MDRKKIKQFRRQLAAGTVFGSFAKTSDPAFVEIMGLSGFDFIILDLEHGPGNILNMQNLVRAAEVSGIIPIIRVKENNLTGIGEALDIGAAGVQVPQVENAAMAENVVRHARYAPRGMRGMCIFVRAAQYSVMDRFEHFKSADSALIVIHLEGKTALDNLGEILDVDGIDVLFIGPYDLSQSLGVPGKIDDPLVEKAMSEVVKKCKKAGKAVGTFADTPKNAAKWRKAGVNYIAYSVDVGIFADACRGCVDDIKKNTAH